MGKKSKKHILEDRPSKEKECTEKKIKIIKQFLVGKDTYFDKYLK